MLDVQKPILNIDRYFWFCYGDRKKEGIRCSSTVGGEINGIWEFQIEAVKTFGICTL